VPQQIQLRQIVHFYRADPAYGIGVAQRLEVEVPEQAMATAAE
jgi:catalase